MPDVTPPPPPSPKAAAKGLAGVLKGKPAWMWVAGVTVLVGFAYLAWMRGRGDQNMEASGAMPEDSDIGPVGGNYGYYGGGDGSIMTPAPTQGAFLGDDYYSDPGLWDVGVPNDTAGGPAQAPVTVNVMYQNPVGGEQAVDSVPTAKAVPAHAATGGGHPARNANAHKPPKKKPRPATHPASSAHPSKQPVTPAKTLVGKAVQTVKVGLGGSAPVVTRPPGGKPAPVPPMPQLFKGGKKPGAAWGGYGARR